MAVIRFTKNILNAEYDTIHVDSGITIENIIRANTPEEDSYQATMCECYDCSTGKSFYAPIESNSDKISAIVVVNGKDENIDYKIKDDDDISIVITPSSVEGFKSMVGGGQAGDSWNWVGAILGNLVGSIEGGLSGMGIGTAFAPGIGSLIGLAIGGAIGGTIGFVAGGIGVGKAYSELNKKTKDSGDFVDSNNLPDVQGSRNTGLIGNPYPVVIGKHVISPFVAASPYATYSGTDGRDEYIRIMYCAGYAPLRLTEFTLDSLPVAHNQSWSGNSNLKTVMHGSISGYDSGSSDDKGEILRKWTNNEIRIEILQQNQNLTTTDYGTIYPKAVIQKSINATPLFICDKSLSDVNKTISYHGASIGALRTNSIRFTEQDPMKVTVMLDFPGGLYSSYTKDSDTVYDSIPCWIAVQWRPYNKNAPDSTGDSSGNTDLYPWYSFDNINDLIDAEIYDETSCTRDLIAHTGNTFDLGSAGTELSSSELAEAVNNGWVIKEDSTSYVEVVHSEDRSGYTYTWTTTEEQTVTKFTSNTGLIYCNGTDMPKWMSTGTINSGWIGARLFNIQRLVNLINTQDGKTVGTTNMKHDEFRCWLTVDLEKWIKDNKSGDYKNFLLNADNTTKSIEVRVIRVSPCYINETSTKGKSYQDIFKWSYLQTVPFKEDRLLNEGVYEAQDVIPSSDMKKFCFISLYVKADTTQNITSQISKFSCCAESFSPSFNTETKKWIPEKVSKVEKYYSPISNGTRTEITKAKFESYRQNGEDAIRTNAGNDYLTQLSTDIFKPSNVNLNGTYARYVLDDDTKNKYICANPASGVALACVGGHLGIDAMGYDQINMMSLGQLFEDCLDITDGSTYSTSDGLHNKGDLVHIYFKCNAFVYQSMKLEDMVSKILTAGRASFCIDDKQRLYVLQDKKVDYPIGIINQQNCISASNSIFFEEPPSGLQIAYHDENDGYDTNYIYCMSDGETALNPKKQIEQYSIDWVTNPLQIWSLGRWVLAIRVISKEIITRKLGWSGYSIGFGNVVKVADDSLLIGENNGARIRQLIEDDNYIYGFITDESYTYYGKLDSSGLCTQGVEIFQPNQYKESKCITVRMATTDGIEYNNSVIKPVAGITNRVIFYKKISKNGLTIEDSASYMCLPEVDDIVAFGEMGRITAEYRVRSISTEKCSKFNFTLIPYDDRLYNYGKELPTFQNHMTIPDRRSEENLNLSKQSVTAEDLQKAVNNNRVHWLGSLSEAPTNPSINDAYYNTTDKCSYIYTGKEWKILCSDGHKGDTGAAGTTYWMDYSASAIKKSSDGVMSPSTLILRGKKQSGENSIEPYACRFKIWINGNTEPTYVSEKNESYVSFPVTKSMTSVIISMYKADGFTDEYDYKVVPVLTDGYAYTILLTDTHQVYDANSSGYVRARSITTEVKAWRGTDEIDVTIGTLPTVTGFSLSKINTQITITALDGTAMQESGVIEIPVKVNIIDSSKNFGRGSVVYGRNSVIYGRNHLSEAAQTFKVYFSYQKSTFSSKSIAENEPVYKGTVSDESSFPSDAKYGDWVLFTGKGYAAYQFGYCYYYTGVNWAIDNNSVHGKGALDDMLNIIDNMDDNDAPAIKFVKVLAASRVFANQVISNEVITSKLESEYASIKKLESEYASIKNLEAGTIVVGKAKDATDQTARDSANTAQSTANTAQSSADNYKSGFENGTYTAKNSTNSTNSTNAANVAGSSDTSRGKISLMMLGGSKDDEIAIESDGYTPGVTGFAITKKGNAEFNNAVLRGSVYANNFNIPVVIDPLYDTLIGDYKNQYGNMPRFICSFYGGMFTGTKLGTKYNQENLSTWTRIDTGRYLFTLSKTYLLQAILYTKTPRTIGSKETFQCATQSDYALNYLIDRFYAVGNAGDSNSNDVYRGNVSIGGYECKIIEIIDADLGDRLLKEVPGYTHAYYVRPTGFLINVTDNNGDNYVDASDGLKCAVYELYNSHYL